jgi:DNA-binding transcriptional LysR family regulator
MHRGTLSDLTTFIAVADSRSFRGAGERLGVTPSALSHSMKQLEERIGTRLLNRTTRSVSLTDAGLRLLEQVRPAFDQISHAMDDLDEARGRPSGRLRVHVSGSAEALVIAPLWRRFLATYPEIDLEVECGTAPVDIVAKGFDAAIGLKEQAASDMIAVRVTDPIKVAVVATPVYFKKHNPPLTPDDLGNHYCIRYRTAEGRIFDWMFERNSESRTMAVNGRVTVNSGELALQAALDGLGMAYVGEFQAGPLVQSGQLVRVLEEWSPEFEGFYLYHPGHRHMPAALRALIDMAQVVRRERRSPALSATEPGGDPRRPSGGEAGRRGPGLVPRAGADGTSRPTDESTQQTHPQAWSRTPAAANR